MQHIIITKDFEIPNCPMFNKGQKVRVKDELADTLVKRSLAKYDHAEKAVTAEAKKTTKKKAEPKDE